MDQHRHPGNNTQGALAIAWGARLSLAPPPGMDMARLARTRSACCEPADFEVLPACGKLHFACTPLRAARVHHARIRVTLTLRPPPPPGSRTHTHLMARAASSYARAASSAVSYVPSHRRAPTDGSLISAAHLPHGRCRTPLCARWCETNVSRARSGSTKPKSCTMHRPHPTCTHASLLLAVMAAAAAAAGTARRALPGERCDVVG